VSDLGVTLADLVHRVEDRSPGGTALERLVLAVELGGQLALLGDAIVGQFVDGARAEGASWAQIGTILGVSKQAAQQRFVPFEPDLTRWTDRAKRALEQANQEAVRLQHAYVGTEHLLLGITKADNLGRRALVALDVDLGALRKAVTGRTGQVASSADGAGPLPYTPLARSALGAALREALRLGHNYIGCEHLVLALAGGEGLAGDVLRDAGVSPDAARRQVIQMLSGLR
jgi:hypothetical protein